MSVEHDPDCPTCAGRGHHFVDPLEAGWKALPERTHDGRRIFIHPHGGLYTFLPRQPEILMIPCPLNKETA